MFISEAKIYKVFSTLSPLNSPDTYIGSTCKIFLEQRLEKHKHDYLLWKENKVGRTYYTIFDFFEKHSLETFVIRLIQKINATSVAEIHEREKHYIQSLPCVNKMFKQPVAIFRNRLEDGYDCPDCGIHISRNRDRKKHESTRRHQVSIIRGK